MRQTCVSTELEQIDFAKKAAACFASNPSKSSYGEITAGGYIALRWGLGDDCVLVLKLDEFHVPTNYGQLVREFPATPETPPTAADFDDCPF